jgi:tetratricopeptide (TPR) repeat protein
VEEAEPPPVPLADVDGDFEIERPFESQAVVAGMDPGTVVDEATTMPRAPHYEEPESESPPEPEAASELEAEQGPEAGPGLEPEPAAGPAAASPVEPAELATVTLGELYLRQGHTQRALETYRQVLAQDPDNARALARLAELEVPSPAADGAVKARRRAAIERTIGRLEGFLAAVRKEA